VEQVFVVPGNGGTAKSLHNVSNIDGIEVDQYPNLVLAAKQHQVGLVVVGPDSAIVEGIEGYFREGKRI
jgi:phosphoribosylamine-glycine ligase